MSSTIISSSLFLLPPEEPQLFYASATAEVKSLVTVPADKTLYLTGIAFYNDSTTSSLNCSLRIDGTIVMAFRLPVAEQSTMYGMPIFVVNGGEELTVVASGVGSSVKMNVWGFYQ
jgi:hypothetical protein